MANVVRTVCSGCMEPVTVDVDWGMATMRIPSNGKRGAGHVPAHDATAEVLIDSDLAMWDCPMPGCDQADSVYVDPETRRVLA